MEGIFTDFGIDLLKWFGIISVIYIIITYIAGYYNDFALVRSRWHHTFTGIHFSAKEIYAAIEEAVKKREIGALVNMPTFPEAGTASSSRLYLRITRDDQMFLICAAPFGTDYFISWWFGEPNDLGKDIVKRIPLIGASLARHMASKTYYQMDTDTMFSDTVKNCVLEVIDSITTTKGVRGLTEQERMPIVVPLRQR